MRAVALQGGYGIDALELVERPPPRPGPRQVLVSIQAVALNYRDLLVVNGTGRWRPILPRIPVSDGAGEVVEIGTGVERIHVGDRVAGIFLPKWLDGDFTFDKDAAPPGSAERDGLLAEIAVFDEEAVVRIPDHLTYGEAATLPCAGVTAWHAAIERGGVRPGDWVLVQGTGGVSMFALQFACLAGARVIVISGSHEKLEKARTLGATEGIHYRETPDWPKAVSEITSGRGVDLVVDVTGARLSQSLAAVRASGTVTVIGVLAGMSAEVSVAEIFNKNVRIHGIEVGSREMFESMNRAISAHGLRPVVNRAFGLDEAREAFRFLASGAHFGKVAIEFAAS